MASSDVCGSAMDPVRNTYVPGAGRTARSRVLCGLRGVDTRGAWSLGLELDDRAKEAEADTGNLETDLGKLVRHLADAAAEQRVELAILIDEAQDLTPDELAAVCATAHSAGQRDRACLFALAGIPSLPWAHAAAKSYSDAAVYVRIDLAAARLGAAQGLPAPESLLSPCAEWPTSYRNNPPTPSPGGPTHRKPTQSLSMLPSRPPTTPAPATFPTLPLSAPAPMTS
jgi:hypothetical protein